jgi:hypothetical protein
MNSHQQSHEPQNAQHNRQNKIKAVTPSFLSFKLQTLTPKKVTGSPLQHFVNEWFNRIVRLELADFKSKLAFASLFLLLTFTLQAQTEVETSKTYLSQNAQKYNLAPTDIENLTVSSSYLSPSTGWHHVYFMQKYKNIEVYNGLLNLTLQNGTVQYVGNAFVPNLVEAIDNASLTRNVTPAEAIEKAALHKSLASSSVAQIKEMSATQLPDGSTAKAMYSDNVLSDDEIEVKQYWLPNEGQVNGKSFQKVSLTWNVRFWTKDKQSCWNLHVDALTGKVLCETDDVIHCTFGSHDHLKEAEKCLHDSPVINPKVELNQTFIVAPNQYNVFDYPLESPLSGPRTVVTNPYARFVPAGTGPGATNGWHNDGTTDYVTTRGNNVWAKEDIAADNETTIGVSPTSPTLDFNFPYSQATGTNVTNRDAATTNLFYWNNLIHDVLYKYGFDEPSGNFQANNMGRGGAGNDFVFADAQDGSGLNNANFATPPDGGNARMQMFIWSVPATRILDITSPAAIARSVTVTQFAISQNNDISAVGPVTGNVVLVQDATGGTSRGCATPFLNSGANSLVGRIAMVDRGTCTFAAKARRAQNAGAIAILIVDNGTALTQAEIGVDNSVTIPLFFLGGSGVAIRGQLTLGNPVTVTMRSTGSAGYQPDSDFDNGIIAHEYGHGWSNRLTGGPSITSCLQNAEQAGEGWSDFLALMTTTNWATLTPSVASANISRRIGVYSNGSGIRPFPYSYDKTGVNNTVTYAGVNNAAVFSQPHGIGSIWATMLWDMTWEIILQDNQIVNDIYTTPTNITDMRGNIAALKLVNEGLRMQPCSPSFVQARDAIFQADQMLFGGRYHCAIGKAFARRGLGANASTGASANDRIVTEDFTPFSAILGSPLAVSSCSNEIFNYTANVSPAGSQTFSWTRAAVTGINNTVGTGNSATISETLVNTTAEPITVQYIFTVSPDACGGTPVPQVVNVVVNPKPVPTKAVYEICQNSAVTVGDGFSAPLPTYRTTINGTLTTNSPTYRRPDGNDVTVYVASTTGTNVYHKTYTFVAPSTGNVTFETSNAPFIPNNNNDTYLALYQTSFDPANPASNFLRGHDDISGVAPLNFLSRLTHPLVAGTTYILVVSSWSNGQTGPFTVTATSPVFTNSGLLKWYTAATGGTPISTGTTFNPIGLAGSGIANTAGTGSFTFYAAYENSASCRVPVTLNVQNCNPDFGTITCPPSQIIAATLSNSTNIPNNSDDVTVTNTLSKPLTYVDKVFDIPCNTANVTRPDGFPYDVVFNTTMATGAYKAVVRAFTATFAGSSSTCGQVFYFKKPDCTKVGKAPDATAVCINGVPYLNPQGIAVGNTQYNGTGFPQFENGSNLTDNSQGLQSSYTDAPIFNGVIVRTWSIKDNCGAVCTTFTQNISVPTCVVPQISISGGIRRESGDAVMAMVKIFKQSDSINREEAYFYNFPSLAIGESYRIRPERNTDVLNGVSTYDISIISRYLLGLEPAKSPYQLIAMDVDRSGEVDGADMIIIRNLILRKITSFPNNTAWRFIPQSYVFKNPANPFAEDFPEILSFSNASKSVSNADFVAVKIGDGNLTARLSNLTNLQVRTQPETGFLQLPNLVLDAEQEYRIPVKINEKSLIALQFALSFDKNVVDYFKIENGNLAQFGEGNYNILNKNTVATAWANSKATSDNTVFTLIVKTKKQFAIQDLISLNSNYSDNLAFNVGGNEKNLQLSFAGEKTDKSQFELHQNRPNPFNHETTISFILPETNTAELSIYDITGRKVYTKSGTFTKGYNEVILSNTILKTTGLYIYHLQSDKFNAVKRMQYFAD